MIENPLIKPACASKQDVLELATLWYVNVDLTLNFLGRIWCLQFQNKKVKPVNSAHRCIDVTLVAIGQVFSPWTKTSIYQPIYKCKHRLPINVDKQHSKGGFHLHLLVFPWAHQFNSRIGVLVHSTFEND